MEEKGASEGTHEVKQDVQALLQKTQHVITLAKKHALVTALILVILFQFLPSSGGAYPWGGIWMRMQAKNLPFADGAADSSVDNYLRDQAAAQVARNYPNLPDANKQKVLSDLIAKIKEQNAAQVQHQRERIADEIRNNYRYEENGQKFPYMPDIDPYHYLRLARNVVQTGHTYEALKDGQPWDYHFSAPVGAGTENTWHPHTIAILYWSMHFFDRTITLMQADMYHPVILIFLSVILVFLVTRKVAGNLGGFFAANLLSILPAIMGRTGFGHADTDTYNVFFPLLIVWLLFNALDSKERIKQAIWGALTGATIAIYTEFWSGWWYMFDFVIGALIIAFVAELIFQYKQTGKHQLISKTHAKKYVLIGATLIITSVIFSFFTVGFTTFFNGATQGAFTFTSIKDASHSNLWPNVLTTVAELNPGSLNDLAASVGGAIMFFIAVLGIVLLLVKRDEHGKHDFTHSILLALWFLGTSYAAFKGVRFTLLLGPAFSIAFGTAAGLLYEKLGAFGERQLHVNKKITLVLLIAILWLAMTGPIKIGPHLVQSAYAQTVNDIPLVNDAWWNSLTKIKNESQPNAIINSWWDFGHHFKYIADRPVTFDGASQDSPQAHWIGKVLQTDNEREAVGILRMLDCGATNGYDFIYNATTFDPIVSINLVQKIIVQDKDEAAATLQNAGIDPQTVLPYTHCDPPEDFFIASADMVSKSGVWGHFGTWDFNRAEVWKKWRFINEEEAIPQMTVRFNWTEDYARQMYREADTLGSEEAANGWISPWPNYLGEPNQCEQQETALKCGNLYVNLTAKKAEYRTSDGYAAVGKLIKYDRFGNVTRVDLEGGNSNLDIVMWPNQKGIVAMASTSLFAESIFTRMYYMNGLGLRYFKPFTNENQLIGGPIYVYKVDWDGKEPYIPKELAPKTKIEKGARVRLNYIGWLDNETIFDSSIIGWSTKNITPTTEFTQYKTQPINFIFGEGKLIPGFEKRIEDMKTADTRTITIPPEEAYGTDPTAHPLGNQTLHFKVKAEAVE